MRPPPLLTGVAMLPAASEPTNTVEATPALLVVEGGLGFDIVCPVPQRRDDALHIERFVGGESATLSGVGGVARWDDSYHEDVLAERGTEFGGPHESRLGPQ